MPFRFVKGLFNFLLRIIIESCIWLVFQFCIGPSNANLFLEEGSYGQIVVQVTPTHVYKVLMHVYIEESPRSKWGLFIGKSKCFPSPLEISWNKKYFVIEYLLRNILSGLKTSELNLQSYAFLPGLRPTEQNGTFF